MKAGKTLLDLAQALHNARQNAKDFIVPAQAVTAVADGAPGLAFNNGTIEVKAQLNNWSHSQLATYADIPRAYYDRIQTQSPELWVRNVNHGLTQQNGDRRMVRILDGKIRALVSSKYRRFDSADLADAVMPALLESGMEVVSSDLTERRFYLRATTQKLQGEIAKGDVIQAGIMLTNSDVGAGSLRVEPFYVRLLCTNGMVREHAIRKTHLGRSLAAGDDVLELLSEDTVRLGEAAFFAEVQDVVTKLLSPEFFERDLAKLKASTEQKITNFDLQQVVDATCKSIGLTANGNVKQSIVEALASGNQGAGLTKWGLANAFTAVAGIDAVDFDQSVELERAGSSIIELTPSQWRTVAEKKAA